MTSMIVLNMIASIFYNLATHIFEYLQIIVEYPRQPVMKFGIIKVTRSIFI